MFIVHGTIYIFFNRKDVIDNQQKKSNLLLFEYTLTKKTTVKFKIICKLIFVKLTRSCIEFRKLNTF